jgi:hypothetical protein
MIATMKCEAIYAAALAKRGCKIVLVLNRDHKIALRYFRACVSCEVYVLEDYFKFEARRVLERRARHLLVLHKDSESFASLEVDGVRTGRNVLSRVLRKFRVGHLDETNEEQNRELTKTLEMSLETTDASLRIIEQIRPTRAIFNEKGYTPAGELFDTCIMSGVDVIQWTSAPYDGAFIFKRYSVKNQSEHPFALGEDTWERIKKVPWNRSNETRLLKKIQSNYIDGAWYNRQQLNLGKRIFSPAELRTRLGIQAGRKIAVVFTHILYDATFFYGKSIFRDYEQWLLETIEAATRNSNLEWLIRVHPVNVWRSKTDRRPLECLEKSLIQEKFGTLPPHVRLLEADNDINTYSFFASIDYGITVRGTIGMELPCFGIPVVTAGTGRYSQRGFTHDPKDRDSYLKTLATLHLHPRLTSEQITLARRYAFATFFLRPHSITSFFIRDASKILGISLPYQNVDVIRNVIQSSILHGDLAEVVEFILDGSDEDLMASVDTVSLKKFL